MGKTIFINTSNAGVKLKGESTWSASGNLKGNLMGHCREHLRANYGSKEPFKLDKALKVFGGI